MGRPERIRLGDVLIGQGLLSAQQVEQALQLQKQTGRRLGRLFVEQGWVSEEQVARSVAEQLRMPFVQPDPRAVDAELVRLLPEVQARRLRAVVLGEDPRGVRVGMADPTDIHAYDELGRLLARPIQAVAITDTALAAVMDRCYRRNDEIASLARELTSELGAADVRVADVLAMESAGVEDAPVVRLLASVFEEALRARASDIHIEPLERLLRIRFRVDGVLRVQTEADVKIASAVALRLKLMSGLDISEKRLPQDGRFAVRMARGMVDVRISTLPTQYGESVVMRLLTQDAGLLDLQRLDMPAPVLQALQRTIARPTGMLLVTGPTGSGKTTTLYAAINALNSSDRKILTAEDPIEYRLPGINQVQVQEKIDLGFERVLRAMLRQDPDVVLIGEMRDRTTSEIGMRAAMTGHLVLSTLHTNDAMSTPLRLLDMGIPAYMVAMSLHMVLAQRLVRRVCRHCRTAHQADPAQSAWLRLVLGESASPLEQTLSRGAGCEVCGGTGYSGRTGVYEFIEMTRELVDALGRSDPIAFRRQAERQLAGQTLQRHAAELALSGVTTLDEAMRVGTQVDEA
jgi:MSHA biogenesis protein MshE